MPPAHLRKLARQLCEGSERIQSQAHGIWRSLAYVRVLADETSVAGGTKERSGRWKGACARYSSQAVSSSNSNSSSNSVNESSSTDSFTSDTQASGIARSLEQRMSRLLAENMESPALETQPNVPEHTLRMTSASKEPDHAQRQPGQWARYREHRVATHQRAAEVQSLLASSPSVAKSSSSITSDSSHEPVSEGRGVNNSDKLQQLRSLGGSPSKEASARGVAAESAHLDPGPMHNDDAPSQRTLGEQGQILAQAEGRSGQLSQHDSKSTLPHPNINVWGSMGPPNGHRPSQSVPIHRQQLLQAGIIGVPNSGKSTLTNALVGSKVSAVSAKTNTTGAARLGAFTEDDCQVALYDTPGVVHTRFLHGPRHARSVRSAWGTASSCELLMCIVDAHRQITKPDIRVYNVVEELASGPLPEWSPIPTILVLNKVDLLSRQHDTALQHLRNRFLQLFPFQGVFYSSARHGTGVQELKHYLLDKCEPAKWIVQSWEATDMGPSDLATEVVREKLFKRLYKELPYRLDIKDAGLSIFRDGSIRIEKHVLVHSNQVRAIVVGARGATIGEIGIGARKDLEAVLDRRVHLMLEVKVASQ